MLRQKKVASIYETLYYSYFEPYHQHGRYLDVSVTVLKVSQVEKIRETS